MGGQPLAVLGLVVAVLVAGCSSGGGGSDGAAPGETRPPPAPEDAPRLPVGRREVAGALWQGEVAVVGGVDERGEASSRLDLYDPVERRWGRGPDLPGPLHHHGLVVLGDRLWLVGGTEGTGREPAEGRPTDEVWSLGPGETAWRPEAPLGTPRTAAGAAVAEGRIVVVGGRGPAGLLATTELYDPATRAWRPGPTLSGEARDHVAVAAVGPTVYALSGQRRVGDSMAIVETLVLPDGQWQEVPPGLDIDRGGATAFVVEGRVCVAGGEPDRQEAAFVECLLDVGWRVIADVTNRRHGMVAVPVGRGVHLVGGGTQSGRHVVNDHEVVLV